MNGTEPDRQHPSPDTTPRLLRFTVNGKSCYALKWSDELTENRREVNYVLREAASDEIKCLLVDGPLRIAGFPELVSVQSTGRTVERAGTVVWELAVTVWADGAVDDEGLIRICAPETFSGRGQYLRDDLKRMIREYRSGTRECFSPAISHPGTSVPGTPPGDTAAEVLRGLTPFLDAVATATEALHTGATHAKETRQLSEENAILRKANAATSAEFEEAVRQFVRRLPHPLSIIFDLRWVRHFSQDRIVAELRRLKIRGCRTKKRVGELLKEIIARGKAEGYTLSEDVTGPQPPRDEQIGYDEATGGAAMISTRTAVDDLTDKEAEQEDRRRGWASMSREEKLSTLAAYRKFSKAEQEVMRKHYGPDFVMELNDRET